MGPKKRVPLPDSVMLVITPDGADQIAMCQAVHKGPFGICLCLNAGCPHSLEGMQAIREKDSTAKLVGFSNERSRSHHLITCAHLKEEEEAIAEVVRSRKSSSKRG